jgi:hypothetical protein
MAFCSLFISAFFIMTVLAQEPRNDLFTRLDANKDGKVVRDELPENQKPNFGKIDANSDGAISRDELNAYTRGGGEAIKPTHADVAYGPHERNKIDLYFTPNGTIQLRSPVPQISLAQNPWPLVTSIHRNRRERFKSRLQRDAFRRAQLGADLMVFNSRHILELYRQNAGGRNGGRHLIAYQGINDETHAHAAQTASNPKHPWTIVSVSAMAH